MSTETNAAATQETQDATQTETQEAAQEVAPEAAAEPAEAATTEVESEDTEAPKPEEKHKRKGGWQRQLERQEREIEFLRQQLASKQPVSAAGNTTEKTAEEKAAEYIDALVEKRLAAKEEQRRQQEAQAEFQRRTLEVRTLHPDFDEVLMSADMPVPAAVSEAILTSPNGPEIMYQLASNPAELARISALPPLAAAREIGRLEAKASVTASPKATPKPVARKPATHAPITPVTARGPSNVKPVEQMSYEEYTAWRESQRKR